MTDFRARIESALQSFGAFQRTKLYDLLAALPVIVWYLWRLWQRLPQLGQRIRTVVQFASLPEDLIHSEGVTPSLVAALSEETELRAGPLPLDSIVPWWRVWAAAAVAAAPVVLIVAVAVVDPEWRIALERALLSDRPYTTIAVAPGNVTVELGANLPIAVELKGRPRRTVVLQTRPVGKPAEAWTSIPLEPSESGPATRRSTRQCSRI